MPGEISGGPSRRHVLPGQAEVDAAEQALQQRSRQAYRPGPPPPAAEFHDPKDALAHPPEGQPVVLTGPQKALAAMASLGRAPKLAAALQQAAPVPMPMAAPPEPEEPEDPLVLEPPMRVTYNADAIIVDIWHNGRAYRGEGQSLSEAMGIAASEFEVGLSKPVCPTCGQVMPEAE